MNIIFERPTLNRTTDKENIALIDRWIADTVDKLNIEPEIGSGSNEDVPTKLSELEDDSMHRTVTDAEKASWNIKPSSNNTYLITDATATAIDDDDHVPFLSSSGKRKITLTNIKAKLKTYFDTVYAAITHTHTKSQITDFAHTHTKTDITDFAHTHTKSDVTDFAHTHTKTDITDFAHTHTKSQITDFAHTHTKTDITDFAHTHTKSEITDFPTLGTAASKDVPTSGNASSSQVVMGNDTRLTDSRTPTSHTHTVSEVTDFPGVVSTSANGLAPKVTNTSNYLKGDGTWATPTNTKNTAGSTDTSSKIYLIGATSQAANPQTYSDNEVFATDGVLTSKKVTTKAITAMTGTGTAGQDKGSGATNRYVPSLWTFNSGITVANGEVYFIKIPVAGGTYGVWLSLNNGTNYYPVAVSNGKGRFTTHYGLNMVIGVTYESAGVCNCYARTGADALADVTGCFRVLDSYDSNTTYSAMSSSELTTGTATTQRTVRADYLKTGINSLIDTKINALDVTGSSTISAKKTISAWSETNGKVSISTQDISITKSQVTDFPTLATVATSGSYTDLINKPTDLISYTFIRNGVTASANTFVRIPASGEIIDLADGVVIPVCDQNGPNYRAVRFKSVIKNLAWEEDDETGIEHSYTSFDILLTEAISNKRIGVVVIGIP